MRTLQSEWKQDLRQSELGWIPFWNIISLIASDFRYNPFVMLFNWRMRRTTAILFANGKFRCCLPSSQPFGCGRLVRFWSVSDKKILFSVCNCALPHCYGLPIGWLYDILVWHFNRYAFILIQKFEMFDVFHSNEIKGLRKIHSLSIRSNNNKIRKIRKRPSNVCSNELSVVLSVVTTFSWFDKVFHFSTRNDMWDSRIHLSCFWFWTHWIQWNQIKAKWWLRVRCSNQVRPKD